MITREDDEESIPSAPDTLEIVGELDEERIKELLQSNKATDALSSTTTEEIAVDASVRNDENVNTTSEVSVDKSSSTTPEITGDCDIEMSVKEEDEPTKDDESNVIDTTPEVVSRPDKSSTTTPEITGVRDIEMSVKEEEEEGTESIKNDTIEMDMKTNNGSDSSGSFGKFEFNITAATPFDEPLSPPSDDDNLKLGVELTFRPKRKSQRQRIDRQALKQLGRDPRLSPALREKIQGAVRRPTGDVLQLTRQLLLDGEVTPELGNQLCQVVRRETEGEENLQHAAKALITSNQQPKLSHSEYYSDSSDGDDNIPLEALVRRQGLQGFSFGILSTTNPFRVFCSKIILHKYTSAFVTILILFNTFSVALIDPHELKGTKDRSTYTKVILIIDFISVYIFFCEYILKMIVLGVYKGKYTLFGRGTGKWFMIDFLIVLLSVILVSSQAGNGISMLRAFRAIRPLRSVRAFSGIRAICDSLIQSLQLLGDSVALLCFSLVIWAIVGIEFYNGALYNRCAVPCSIYLSEESDFIDGICENKTTSVIEANPPIYCSTPGNVGDCPGDMTCVEFRYLVYPFIYANFDNLPCGLLAIFQVITLASWSSVMHAHIEAVSDVTPVCYFISVVVFISWIVLNLFVAVINTVFTTIRSKQKKSGFGGGDDLSRLTYIWNKFTAWILSLLRCTERAAIKAAQYPMKGEGWEEETTIPQPRENVFTRIIESRCFEGSIMIVILANLVMQSSKYRGMSQHHNQVLATSEHVFAAIFLSEVIMRIAAYKSLVRYLEERWNVFDLCMVVISYITLYGMSTNVAFLRSFRVFRAVRLLRASECKSLKSLVDNSLAALVPSFNVTVFFVFGLLVFAGLGKQLIGGSASHEITQKFRTDFESLGYSIISLFVIMTGDSWFKSMYYFMDSEHGLGVWIFTFYIAFYIWAVWVMLSLFTAVVLEAFDLPEEEKTRRIRDTKTLNVVKSLCREPSMSHKALGDSILHRRSNHSDSPIDVLDDTTFRVLWQYDSRPPVGDPASETLIGLAAISLAVSSHRWRSHCSLYIFTPGNPIRKMCSKIASSQVFEYSIIVVIAASCSILVYKATVEPPEAFSSKEETIERYYIIDQVVGFIFCLEFVVKVIASGFVNEHFQMSPKPYLKDPWNRLDFLLLVLMFVAPSAKSMRVLRALRPLRLIRRMERMKIIMSALWKSIPMIFTVLVLSCFVYLIFGLIGMELFMSKLDYCTDIVKHQSQCNGNFINSVGVFTPRSWCGPNLNFDSLHSSVFTLLQVVSLNNWSVLLYQTIDATSEGQAPSKNSNPLASLFFISVIVISTFFLLNVFIGVIIVSINEEENVELLTEDQRNWRELRKQLSNVQPRQFIPVPEGKIRAMVYQIVESVWFSLFILFWIVMCLCFLIVRHRGQSTWLTESLYFLNVVVLVVFTVEVSMKIFAYGAKAYFTDCWNRYDFILVCGNVLCSMLLNMSPTEDIAIITFASRFFRIGRLIRLVKRTKGIRFLLETLLGSLKAITNAFVMLAFLLFIWGLSGVTLFGNIRFQKHLNSQSNFRTFGSSVLLLFQLGTLDGWNDVMWDCSIQPPFCTSTPELTDCGPALWVSKFYFSSFFMVGSCVIYNLLIGIIIDEFAICYSTRYFELKPAHIEDFVFTWQMEDQENKNEIPRWRLLRLIQELESKGNALGFHHRSPQYHLLLFHIDLIEQRSQQERSDIEEQQHNSNRDDSPTAPNKSSKSFKFPQTRKRKCSKRPSFFLKIGSASSPFKFHTVLLMLARLRVPDTALIDSELELRRNLKQKAQVLYHGRKAVATLKSFVTILRLDKVMGDGAKSKLEKMRKDLREQCIVNRHTDDEIRKKRNSQETQKSELEVDTIDYRYGLYCVI